MVRGSLQVCDLSGLLPFQSLSRLRLFSHARVSASDNGDGVSSSTQKRSPAPATPAAC